MGLLDMDRQAELAQMAKDAERSSHGLLNDSMIPTSLYGSLMQDPADKERMDRQMLESTLAMMPMAGMTMWHGSPHSFNKFLSKYLGTGEGVHAFSKGLYFGQAKGTGIDYMRNLAGGKKWTFTDKVKKKYSKDLHSVDKGLSKNNLDEDSVHRKMNEIEAMLNHPYQDKAYQQLARERFSLGEKRNSMLAHRKGIMDKMKHEGGSQPNPESYLYKVDVPDHHVGNMLDLDKPLGKQKGIWDKLEPILKKDEYYEPRSRFAGGRFSGWKKATGHDLIDSFDDVEGLLKSKGVPGVKYWDKMSRGGKKGTRNFVVYDDSIIKMKEKIPYDPILNYPR